MKRLARTPTCYQMESAECGAASLVMILAYFGENVSLEQMRMETDVSRDGVSAGKIQNAARYHGLDCHGFKRSAAALKNLCPPCILFWEQNHFVVLEGFRGRRVYINDPAFGRRRLTWDELEQAYSGLVLTFDVTDRFIKSYRRKSARRVLSDTERSRVSAGTVIRLIGVQMLLQTVILLIPLLIGKLTDSLIDKGLVEQHSPFWIMTVFFVCTQLFLVYDWRMLLQKLVRRITVQSEYDFLRHLLHLPISFFQQRSVGELANRVSGNAQRCRFLSFDLPRLAGCLWCFVLCAGVMGVICPMMTVAALVGELTADAAVWLAEQAEADDAARTRLHFSRIYSTLCSALGVVESLKALGAEERCTEKLLTLSAEHAVQKQRLLNRGHVLKYAAENLRELSVAAVCLIGWLQAARGAITYGRVAAFLLLLTVIREANRTVCEIMRYIPLFRENTFRTDDIRYHQEDSGSHRPKGTVSSLEKLTGELEVRDICFDYSRWKQPPLIAHCSFRLTSGAMVALVGASGSGKTTLVRILGGLYKPFQGEIFYNGVPISEVERERFIGSVASVGQQTALFSGTVRENIVMWNDVVTDSDMRDAARDACIDEFIASLPGGYDYRLTEDGSNLSGGERQRIAIARALVLKPSVLLLDEATSALDAATEQRVLYNIRRRGCTCLMIAHRRSAVRACGRVIVLADGHIAADGTHEALTRQNEFYRKLVTEE